MKTPAPVWKGMRDMSKRKKFWMYLAKICLMRAGCNEYDIDKALEEV